MTDDVLTLVRDANPVAASNLPAPDSADARKLVDGITGHRRRSIGVAFAAAAIVGGIVIATPALGVGDAIRDLFGGERVTFEQTPPVDTARRLEFAELFQARLTKPWTRRRSLRRRVSSRRSRSAGTNDVLWVAPTKKGGYCYEYEHLGGGCKNTPRDRGHIDLNGSYVLRPGATAPVMEKLAGEVFDPEATALRVEFEDGRAFPGAFRLRL